jgi:fatty acid desaturase
MNKFNLRDFSQPSDLYGLRIVALEWILMISAGYLLTVSSWYIPVAIFIFGRAQWVLVDNVGHYATHFTLFRNKTLNKGLDFLYFLPAFVTFKEWQDEHMIHHKALGAVEDPENQRFERWMLPTENFWKCFILVPFSDFTVNLKSLFVFRDYSLTLFWILTFGVVIFSGAWLILCIYLVSYFCLRPYLSFLSEVAEHWNAGVNHTRWNVRGSRLLVGFFKVFKPYGDNLHWFHHEFPGIPGGQIRIAYKSYKATHAIPHEQNVPEVIKELA